MTTIRTQSGNEYELESWLDDVIANAGGKKLSVYRLLTKEGGHHMGFVVIDPEKATCHINAGDKPVYSEFATFAFCRIYDAISHALSGGGVEVPLRTVGIDAGGERHCDFVVACF